MLSRQPLILQRAQLRHSKQCVGVRAWRFFVPDATFAHEFYSRALVHRQHHDERDFRQKAAKVQAHSRSVHQRGYTMIKSLVLVACVLTVWILSMDEADMFVKPWILLLKTNHIFAVCIYAFLGSAVLRSLCTMWFNKWRVTFPEMPDRGESVWLDWLNAVCAFIELICLKIATTISCMVSVTSMTSDEAILDKHGMAAIGIMYLHGMRMFVVWFQMVFLLKPWHARVVLCLAELFCFMADFIAVSLFGVGKYFLVAEAFQCFLTVAPILLLLHYSDQFHECNMRPAMTGNDLENQRASSRYTSFSSATGLSMPSNLPSLTSLASTHGVLMAAKHGADKPASISVPATLPVPHISDPLDLGGGSSAFLLSGPAHDDLGASGQSTSGGQSTLCQHESPPQCPCCKRCLQAPSAASTEPPDPSHSRSSSSAPSRSSSAPDGPGCSVLGSAHTSHTSGLPACQGNLLRMCDHILLPPVSAGTSSRQLRRSSSVPAELERWPPSKPTSEKQQIENLQQRLNLMQQWCAELEVQLKQRRAFEEDILSRQHCALAPSEIRFPAPPCACTGSGTGDEKDIVHEGQQQVAWVDKTGITQHATDTTGSTDVADHYEHSVDSMQPSSLPSTEKPLGACFANMSKNVVTERFLCADHMKHQLSHFAGKHGWGQTLLRIFENLMQLEDASGALILVSGKSNFKYAIENKLITLEPVDDGFRTKQFEGVKVEDEAFSEKLREFAAHRKGDRDLEGHPMDGAIFVTKSGIVVAAAVKVHCDKRSDLSMSNVGTRHGTAIDGIATLNKSREYRCPNEERLQTLRATNHCDAAFVLSESNVITVFLGSDGVAYRCRKLDPGKIEPCHECEDESSQMSLASRR